MITTLIPAFKPKYLNELLIALQAQTVPPSRVIVSDDSPDGAFQRILSEPGSADVVRRLNLEVVQGPRQGSWANCHHLLQLHDGRTPLFHLLFDDDVPYPAFYARHIEAHRSATSGCVVSRRWYALESGQPVSDLPLPAALEAHPERTLQLPATLLFPQVVGTCNNWLGEFSNITFRSELRDQVILPQIGGVRVKGLEDIACMLMLSQRAPLTWLNQHLGYFRTSAEQTTRRPMSTDFKRAVLGWIALAIGSMRAGHVDAAMARNAIAHMARSVRQRYPDEADIQVFIALEAGLIAGDATADDAFVAAWHDFIV